MDPQGGQGLYVSYYRASVLTIDMSFVDHRAVVLLRTGNGIVSRCATEGSSSR